MAVHAEERDRIVWLNLEEQARHQLGEPPRCNKAERRTGQDRAHPLGDHQAQHALVLGAERDPHADLRSPLRDRVRQHTVHAREREHQRQPREYDEQQHRHTPRRD
jgi:hypothetical protein